MEDVIFFFSVCYLWKEEVIQFVLLQCLVKGCHKRLGIVHTIEFGNGGSDVQIMRVATYEEEWVSPANLHDERYYFIPFLF